MGKHFSSNIDDLHVGNEDIMWKTVLSSFVFGYVLVKDYSVIVQLESSMLLPTLFLVTVVQFRKCKNYI